MTRPQDLATRIRMARTSLKMTQADLAARVGVNRNAISDWEAGRHLPRTTIPDLERVLGVDLSSEPESTAPRLDEASDAQVLADVARRLADQQQIIRDLRRRLGETDPDGRDARTDREDNVVTPGRWAARTRQSDPE